jgi:hypothetical protein
VLERFVVRYAVERGEPPREQFFPSLPLAEEFARRVATDGTTVHPHAVTVLRTTGEDDRGAWREDRSFGRIEIRRGKRTHEPGDLA